MHKEPQKFTNTPKGGAPKSDVKDKQTNDNGKQIDEKKEIDLRSDTKMLEKKVKRTYDLVDDELKVITLDNDLVVKLIANNKGVFVDFRKYYKGYPTKKGIRILATKFQEVARVMNDDINRLVPNTSSLEDLNNI